MPTYTLHGSVVPIVSPLTAAEEIDLSAIQRLVAFHAAAGTDGLFVLGTCGEGPCLSDICKELMVHAVVQNAQGLPVLVGISETGTRRAVESAKRLAIPGVTALVVMPPTFQFAMTAEEHADHVQAIADAVEIPVIVYNLPKKTGGSALPVEAVRVLLERGSIIGIKDSSGDLEYIGALLQLREEFPNFGVMNGELKTAAAALRMGADGLVMSYTNIAPGQCKALIDAVRAGDDDRAEALQAEFLAVWGRFPATAGVTAKVKAILAALELCQPYCCGPNRPLAPVLPSELQETRV